MGALVSVPVPGLVEDGSSVAVYIISICFALELDQGYIQAPVGRLVVLLVNGVDVGRVVGGLVMVEESEDLVLLASVVSLDDSLVVVADTEVLLAEVADVVGVTPPTNWNWAP